MLVLGVVDVVERKEKKNQSEFVVVLVGFLDVSKSPNRELGHYHPRRLFSTTCRRLFVDLNSLEKLNFFSEID